MYQQKSRFNHQRSPSSRPGNRSGGNQRSHSPRRNMMKSMDISLLVNKVANVEQPTEIVYVPTNSFADFALCDQLKKNIADRGYITPTPIQDQAIPHLLEGKDVIGIANTGTGKTAAFLIPLLNKLYYKRDEKVLIIAPTRELAVQITDECKQFARNMDMFGALCIGGLSMRGQIYDLRDNPNIVIGTPGRLKDLANQGEINFSSFSNIVLDEVDRMLDMGFVHEITQILAKLPKNRQALFFSATLPDSVKGIMREYSNNPVTISVKTRETSANINQDVIKTMGKDKVDVLHDLLIQKEFDKVLVFGRTKWGMEKLAKSLVQRGFKVAAIHGNKSQQKRQQALDDFKSDRVQVLLATDIASRGLDIENVSHVINFDLPATYEDYVHRIGRTGRGNNRGTALTLI